jgi:hypothetical protein
MLANAVLASCNNIWGTHVGSSMSCLCATSRRIQGRYIRSSMLLLLNDAARMLFDVTTCMWLSTELASLCWQLSTLIRSLINVPGNKHVQQHTLGCRDWSANTRWMVAHMFTSGSHASSREVAPKSESSNVPLTGLLFWPYL